MPFYAIHGSFHVLSRNRKGKTTGFQPDGDSVHFKPSNPELLDKLDQAKAPYSLTLTALPTCVWRG